ncbi:MAG: hypothetical protein GX659_04585 [Myxococcales bacterium]|nr:hypothetical protein [Myxococcales bacterium]
MPAHTPPRFNEEMIYRKHKWGIFGELGEGGNAQIRFLQTVISHVELDDIQMISDIPGSHKWEVRDLFQREVDSERVKTDILPYFQDPSKVKYFNPLTLIVLPMAGHEVSGELDYINSSEETENNETYTVYEKKEYYKMSIRQDVWCRLQWNPDKCCIVAIDGQHRLSALKRWKKEPDATKIQLWRIPVVLLVVNKSDASLEAANLLEIVRRTFVYINTKAERLSTARKILLDDESVNAVCAQEIVQYAHANDVKAIDERVPTRVPLIFFDWRGGLKDNVRIKAPAAMISIEEVYSWMEHYILKEDGGVRQEERLFLKDLVPMLESYGTDKALTNEDARRIRELFCCYIREGLMYFLENFEPYKNYIHECREKERACLAESDLSKHAFMKLRFGSHDAEPSQRDDVEDQYCDLVTDFENIKNKIPAIITRDVGPRALIFSFSQIKYEYDEIMIGKNKERVAWLDYAKMLTPIYNDIYNDGWFLTYDSLAEDKRKALTHILYDPAGGIINYRLEDSEDAFGAFIMMLVLKGMLDNEYVSNDEYSEIWSVVSDKLFKTLNKGFRKVVRSELKDVFQGTNPQFNAEVKRLAQLRTEDQLKKLAARFGIVDVA